VILGTFLSGIPVSNGQFSGGPFNFLSPFSILVGLLVMAVYGMLGAGWLIHKSEGELRSSSRRRGHVLVVVVAVLLLIALAATPFATPIVGNLLDSTGRLVLVVAMLVVAAVGLVGAYVAFNRRDDTLPFLCAALAVTALIVGGVGAVYPYAVPPTITFQQATSPANSINFLLVVTVLAVPVTMVYNAYTYYVFRGKFELPRPRGTDNR
ncbi:MAG: cytochrome d ubiquinol oxidase subunit II, partial [Rubrobacter sp.]|nr:cytochrome d ubiquinol oxidase subunit II [Rubrobacter sp.]